MHESDGSTPRSSTWMFHLGKIIEGALQNDDRKVRSYTKRLGEQLREDGDDAAAQRLNDLLAATPKSRKMGLAKSTSAIPVDAEARLPVADEVLLNAENVSVVLEPDTSTEVKRFIKYVQAADRLAENGVGVSPSMLIYGPPGCGKTQLARHIAASLGLPLITARTDALISSYLGSTSKNLRSLFEFAASHPCVLFLDELDALGKMRDDDRELGELKRVVISLLQNIDALDRDHVLLAATNHEHLLDQALWRRFSFHIKLNKPSSESRRKLLALFTGGRMSTKDTDLLTAASESLSGAEIRTIVNNGIRDSVLSDSSVLDVRAMMNAMSKAGVRGPEREELVRNLRRSNPNMRQSEIAQVLGISQPTVSRILKSENIDA